MVGNRSRMVARLTVMSVLFMTTAAWAWRANAGETGRASTDIARSIKRISAHRSCLDVAWSLAAVSVEMTKARERALA